MVAEKICRKAANWCKGCWPLNRGFQKMFSDSCRFLHQLSKFAIKNLVQGRKVKFMAFLWPFWPLKVKFWNILCWTRSCQPIRFGLASLNGFILKIIFGSPITRRDYVVDSRVSQIKQPLLKSLSIRSLHEGISKLQTWGPYLQPLARDLNLNCGIFCNFGHFIL